MNRISFLNRGYAFKGLLAVIMRTIHNIMVVSACNVTVNSMQPDVFTSLLRFKLFLPGIKCFML